MASLQVQCFGGLIVNDVSVYLANQPKTGIILKAETSRDRDSKARAKHPGSY